MNSFHRLPQLYQPRVQVRAKLDANRACLQRLVPLLQRAAIQYVTDPGPVNGVLIDFTARIKGGTQISAAGGADAVQRMTSLGIVGNGPDGVFGAYDNTRIQSLIDAFSPVFRAAGKAPRAGLQPADIYTNEFLDRAIRL